MLHNWLKIFVKNCEKRPLYPIVNLIGLTAGISCFLLTMLYVDHEFSYDQWNPNKEDVYSIINFLPEGQTFSACPGPLPPYMMKHYPEVEDYTMYQYGGTNLLTYEKVAIYKKKINATAQYFKFFPYPFVYGNPDSALVHPRNIVISEIVSKELFGDVNPIGQSIKLQNKEFFKVSGVFQITDHLSHFDHEVVTLVEDDYRNASWENFDFNAYIKAGPGFDAKRLSEEIKRVHVREGAKYLSVTEEKFGNAFSGTFGLEKIKDIHLYSFIHKGKGTNTIITMSLLSLMILLISAINFTNLSIAGAGFRAKEVAIRKTMGENRWNIIFQFIIEVMLTCLIALIGALAIVELLLPAFEQIWDVDLSIKNLFSNAWVICIVLVLLLLASAITPAIYLSKFNPVYVLKGNFSRSKQGALLKKGLIIFQMVISSVFLIGTLIINAQIDFMNNADVGFDRAHVLMIPIKNPEEVIANREKYLNFFKEKPYVLSTWNVGTNNLSHVFHRGKKINSRILFIDEFYLPGLKIELLEGRNFTAEDLGKRDKVIVNERFVEMQEMEDPIGNIVEYWRKDQTIIGVVKNHKWDGFEEKIGPVIYGPDNWPSDIMVKMKSENMEAHIAEIESFWSKEIEVGFPFQYEFLDESYAESYLKHIKLQKMVLALSIIMTLLSLLGLIAVAIHTIQQRYREIAIRKTIGASEQELLFLLIKEFIWIGLIALAIAMPIAWGLAHYWLSGFAYHIAMPILPFFLVAFVVMILSIGIILLQARKAIHINLVQFLKYE